MQEVEKVKMELSTLPEHVVVETTEHKCLQSQFSVLYNEAMQLKTQLEEARTQLQVIEGKRFALRYKVPDSSSGVMRSSLSGLFLSQIGYRLAERFIS